MIKKNKIILVIALTSLCVVFVQVLCACNFLFHTHSFEEGYSGKDETNHWHMATCEHKDEINGKEPHAFKDGVCTVCGYEKGSNVHTHSFEEGYSGKDETNHWHIATCEHKDEISGKTAHTFKNSVCTVCGYIKGSNVHTHTFEEGYSGKDETNHWHIATCEHRDEISSKELHTFKNGVCTVCGYEKEDDTIEKFVYELSDDGQSYIIKSFSPATNTNIEIPSSYNNKSVTSVGRRAFSGCSDLTRITIPSSVTSIGEDAFYNCSSIANVCYTGDLAGWCSICFGNIYANPLTFAHNLYIENTCVTEDELIIPDTLTELKDYIFYGCTSMTSVIIGNGVTTIGKKAFGACEGLTSVTIGNSVTSIGNNAFSYCNNLTSITIPDSITSIGDDAFYNCSNLQNNEYDNALYLGNENNSYVVLLKAKSTDITSCTINENTKIIVRYAFSGCSRLTCVTIPDSVTSIGGKVFSGCNMMDSIVVDKGNTVYHSTNNCLIETATKTLVAGCKSSIIPTDGSVTTIGEAAFGSCEMRSIIIPDNVTTIGKNAFTNCRELTNVTIGNGVTTIGEAAFGSCEKLTSITIPDSVTYIDEGAFNSCLALTSVTIGNGVTTIGEYAFTCCEKLTSITIPDSVTIINDGAFDNCRGLTSVTIGNGVTTIGKRAFGACEELTSVTIGNGVTKIDIEAFQSCNKIEYASLPTIAISRIPKNNLLTLVITSGDTIYSDSFLRKYDGNPSTNVIIGNTVKSIGAYAFYECTWLTSITIPNSVTTIDDSAFANCSELTNITIGNGVKSIGINAFHSCYKLTSIIIPANVITIGNSAFCECMGLTNATIIGNDETSIGAYAFEGCKKLASVVIGSGVKKIGIEAFKECIGLTKIKYDGTVAQWNAIKKEILWCDGVSAKKVICSDGEVTL